MNGTEWRWLWKVLVVHSLKDLLRYKSFLLLIAALIAGDRVFQHYLRPDQEPVTLPPLSELGPLWAAWFFDKAPPRLWALALDGRVVAALLALFGVKELVSLWPSSDMRRMHRGERGRSGFLGALAALRLGQVVWDATATAILTGIGLAWVALSYVPTRALWLATGWVGWLAVCGALIGLGAPAVLAGLSYSSKLAVISQGRFGEKLGLFLRLFTDWRLFWQSWVFCVARLTVEAVFALAVPVWAFATLDSFWLRIAIASVFAAPTYSYVKMATFKFFLEIDRDPFRIACPRQYRRIAAAGDARDLRRGEAHHHVVGTSAEVRVEHVKVTPSGTEDQNSLGTERPCVLRCVLHLTQASDRRGPRQGTACDRRWPSPVRHALWLGQRTCRPCPQCH